MNEDLDWGEALVNCREMINYYRDGQAFNKITMIMYYEGLLQRYQDGERSEELYERMIDKV